MHNILDLYNNVPKQQQKKSKHILWSKLLLHGSKCAENACPDLTSRAHDHATALSAAYSLRGNLVRWAVTEHSIYNRGFSAHI